MTIRHAFCSVLKFSKRECSVCFHIQMNSLLRIKLNALKGKRLLSVSSVYYKKGSRKKPTPKIKRPRELKELEVWKNITVEEVATALNISFDDMALLLPGHDFDFGTPIQSPEIMASTAHKMGYKLKIVKHPNEEKLKEEEVQFVRQPPPKAEDLVQRPPVVTVMGHVDHGKTTLLDSLRNTFVAQQEFGGITQHIGAFIVEVKSGQKITFIDTPGHAAFTAMRSRGAEVTDLVVLVIAADDGVMEQTVESINIIKRAKVPLIVAVNKIDKPSAMKIDDIKEKLLYEGIQVEDKGGEVQIVPVSALKKINLDLLTEMILLEADLMKLKGDPKGKVEGVVIESKMDKKGMLATVIIKRGTLKKGTVLMAGKAHARVRVMLDENGNEYKSATPSTPVQVLGWRALPTAGDEVFEVGSEKEAMRFVKQKERETLMRKQEEDLEVIKERAEKNRIKHFEEKLHLETAPTYYEKRKRFFEMKQMKQTTDDIQKPRLSLILKGDVYGTVEVLLQVLSTYTQHDECELTVVSASVGNITPTDVENAEVFNAMIYAFNVNLHKDTEPLAQKKNIVIRFHNVLYKLVDDLKMELNARILPKDDEKNLGEAEVLQHFTVTEGKKKVPVAGCRCTRGELKKESLYRILRGDQVIYEGTLSNMKHLKNEVKTIQKGTDCGLMFAEFSGKFSTGDRIVCYEKIKVPQTTSWNPGF